MRKLSFCTTLLAMLLGSPYLFAGTFVMGYTPAGGVTIAPGGSPPFTSSPALYAYSNFNGSSYQALYYGVNYVANVAQVGAPTGNMAFQGYNSTTGVLAWGSTQNWSWAGTVCGYNGPTQFLVQIQPYTGTAGFLPSGFLNGDTTTKGALAISGNASDPLFQIVSAGNFQTTFQFLTWDGNPADLGTGQDLQDLYDGCSGGAVGQFMTSVDFEFWWSIPHTAAKKVQVGTCLTNLPNYATIATAVAAVSSGATVEICPGNYSEQVTINSPITLVGVARGTNESVVLSAPGFFEQNGTGPVSSFPIFAQILVQDAGPVNISGITVDGSSSSCPNGAVAGVVYLSKSSPSSGKFSSSVVRNIGNQCSSAQAAAVYGENGSGFASTLTVQGNSIHSINGQGIVFGPNVSGTITSNTVAQASGGLVFQGAGPNVKATSNNIVLTQNAISLNSASGVVAQSNQLIDTSNTAISLHDNTGGSNNVTKNTINESNCGISTSQANSTDVYFPNTVLNANMTTCQ
jgi:hypothetical protein